MQYVACHQGTAGVTAEFSQRERRAAAQIVRHVETAAYRQVGAASGFLEGHPCVNVAPAGTRIGVQKSTGRPSRSACIGAPLRQMSASVLNLSVGPDMVISSAAASSRLPTARLPKRNDRLSIGPEGGTPTFQ